jgi:hypothetical protein
MISPPVWTKGIGLGVVPGDGCEGVVTEVDGDDSDTGVEATGDGSIEVERGHVRKFGWPLLLLSQPRKSAKATRMARAMRRILVRCCATHLIDIMADR